MIEPDTIKLLRECDAGIKMGISSIGDVLSHIHADDLRCCLSNCMAKHEELEKEIEKSLNSYDDGGKSRIRWPKGCHGSRQTQSLPWTTRTRRSRTS